MEQRIVFKNLDGSCGVIIPAPKVMVDITETIPAVMGVDEDDNPIEIKPEEVNILRPAMTIEEIAAKDVPSNAVSYRITNVTNIPSDRTFRGAWTDDNETATVDVDMVKAKVIHMDKLREMREEKFKEMGYPFKLDPVIEEAIVPQATRDKLQALRDIPQTFDLSRVTKPETLKNKIPNELA